MCRRAVNSTTIISYHECCVSDPIGSPHSTSWEGVVPPCWLGTPISGAYLMRIEELWKMIPSTLLQFTRTSKLFSWPPVTPGMHIRLYWYSPQCSTAYLPTSKFHSIPIKGTTNIVWHHPTCLTNFNKPLEWSPDSIWDHRVHQRLSYQLLEGCHWVTEHFLSLPPGRGTVCRQQSLLHQPCIIPSSPENSSIHRIFPNKGQTCTAL